MMLFLYILLVNFGFPQNNWINFTDSDHLFSVLAPGQMRSSEKMVETGSSEYVLNTVYFKSNIDSTGNKLYLINYYEIEEGLFSLDSNHLNVSFLEIMAEDFAQSVDGELMYVNPVTDEFFSSLEFRITYGNDEENLKGKMVLSPTHLFSLQVYTNKKNALNKEMDYFLDSFRLLN